MSGKTVNVQSSVWATMGLAPGFTDDDVMVVLTVGPLSQEDLTRDGDALNLRVKVHGTRERVAALLTAVQNVKVELPERG